MAERGKPLPFSKRMDIRTMTINMPIKVVARSLQISRNTVRKYKFDPSRSTTR